MTATSPCFKDINDRVPIPDSDWGVLVCHAGTSSNPALATTGPP
jgi:hypothetical protein